MPEQPIHFTDASQVNDIMKMLAVQFKNGTQLAGVGLLATFAEAIATLAAEIEDLKNQKATLSE